MEEERPPRGLPKALLDPDVAYSPFVAYGQSKTGNILFSVSLTEALKERGVRSFSVHPGCEYSTRSFCILALMERGENVTMNSNLDGTSKKS